MNPSAFRQVLPALLLSASLLASACSAQSPTTGPESTPDLGPIYTQAAQTIEARFQQTEAARPSATPQPSSTPEPTPAPSSTATQAPTATATSAAAAPTATNTTAVLIIPTATRGTTSGGGNVVVTATPAEDRAELVSLSPGRGLKVQKGASWDMTVTVKNTGGFTWKQSTYALRYSRGDQLGPSDFGIQKDVKPGESYSFVFNVTAPDTTGPRQVYWALTNSEGRELMWIDFNIEVTE